MRAAKISFFILPALILAAGCNEEKQSKAQRQLPPSAADLYEFKAPAPPPPPPPLPPTPIIAPPPPPPPPPPPAPDPVLPPVVFPDTAPIERAAKAARLLEERRRAGAIIIGLPEPEPIFPVPPPEWRLKDDDYGRDNLPEDRSTLPVDRFRVITADRYIGAVLENAVNSQVPGRVVAVVERHIFGADGRMPLFPKGTRIVCDYEPLAKVGDTRLPINCSRAIRPDGASIQLTDAQGADQMARTGFIGVVDNRIWERYGTAMIVSVLSAASSLGAGVTTNETTARGGNALSQNLGQVTAKVLEQSVDLAPVVEIPAGSKIQIIPRVDIWLRKPEIKKADSEGSSSPASAPANAAKSAPAKPRN